ncbi:MAG: FAD binding domain-containing protein [Anaerolineae bacterium]|nr:FAD binding domain-containing protein [Anaerolineae bacterium]MDW8072192.1 FAD binding domain-containing protein [Anaerolineae bacterium]
MMRVKAYYRPHTLEEALRLLHSEDAVPLAGGQQLLAEERHEAQAVVDLQALGLDRIEMEGERLRIGAMVRLQQLVDAPHGSSFLAEAAHRDGPLTYRNAATVGGTIVTHDPLSCLLLSLLVLDAEVEVQRRDGALMVALEQLVTDPAHWLQRGLVTAVMVTLRAGGTAMAVVARTPRDRPTVAVVARVVRQGDRCAEVRLAWGGVAAYPLRAHAVEQALSSQTLEDAHIEAAVAPVIAALQPRSDFRGSAEYRRAMIGVLTRRALWEAWSKAT